MASWNPFRLKAQDVKGPLGDPSRRLMQYFFGDTGKRSATYQQFMLAEMAMAHPVVYRCLNKIALSVQGIKWYVEPTGEKGHPAPKAKDIKAIQDVLDNPCDTMNADQFRYWLALNKACFGRFALKVGRNIDDNVGALYPLQASYFNTVISKTGVITRYEYGTAENVERLPPRSQVDPRRDNNFSGPFAYEYITPGLSPISMLKSNGDKNNSPLNSIGLPANIVSMLLQRAHDTASGHPNIKYIVSAEKTMDKPQEDELKGEFDEREVGAEKSGNILLITNTTVKVDKLDNGLEDIHTKVPMDDMTRMIYSAFGIPIALGGIGSADAAKFAGNFEASRQSLFEDTIIPGYCDPIAGGLTAAICPVGLRIRFDYDSIPALDSVRARKAKELEPVTFLDEVEKREMCGFGPRKGKTNDT